MQDEGDPTGSVRDYYRAISYNQMDVQFEILPSSINGVPTAGSTNLDDYAYLKSADFRTRGGSTENTSHLNNLRNDLSELDRQVRLNLTSINRDYATEFGDLPVIVIQPGYSSSSTFINNSTDYVWAHKFSFFSNVTNSWRNYNINPFKSLKPGAFLGNTGDARIGSIGVIAHESLHSFGLPDLYDTDGEGAGMGKISVMAVEDMVHQTQAPRGCHHLPPVGPG